VLTLLATAEPSHLPFYIAGGVLALWAVALAGVGLTRPAFPFRLMGERAVVLVSFLLAVATIASAIATSK
jgi:hypothetical protein